MTLCHTTNQARKSCGYTSQAAAAHDKACVHSGVIVGGDGKGNLSLRILLGRTVLADADVTPTKSNLCSSRAGLRPR